MLPVGAVMKAVPALVATEYRLRSSSPAAGVALDEISMRKVLNSLAEVRVPAPEKAVSMSR